MNPITSRSGSPTSSLLLLTALLTILPLTGCPGAPSDSQPPPPPAWSPSPNDFRFQGVGGGMSTTSYLNVNFGGGGGWTFNNAWGSPIELGNGICVPGYTIDSCSWFLHLYQYTSGQQRDTTAAYESSLLTNLSNFPNLTVNGIDLSKDNLVIRSLDVQPGNNGFAVALMSSPSVSGFQPSLQHMLLSDLQAFAASEGLKSRVVTALSLDSPTTCYVFSYGWASDANSVYETSVEPVTKDTVAGIAESMASQGYVITAFGAGGEPNFGWYMVGTRLQGSTASRPIFVGSPDVPSDAQYFEQGYANVVAIYDNPAPGTSTRIWIVEK